MLSIENERFALENVAISDSGNAMSLYNVPGSDTISSLVPEVVPKQSGVDLNKLNENIAPVKVLAVLIESHNL
jgi:hypothetical protein